MVMVIIIMVETRAPGSAPEAAAELGRGASFDIGLFLPLKDSRKPCPSTGLISRCSIALDSGDPARQP